LKPSILIFALWGFSVALVVGQDNYKFRPVNNIPMSKAGTSLELAWAGGINSGQYGTIDVNGDAIDDLVIFDRTTGKINTFISTGSDYQYQPEYEYLFPTNLNSWMLLADYDCDGKKDIFTNTTFGLKVFRNTSTDQLSFELQEDPLQTESGGQMVNLQVSSSDLPAISDVDGDGDLDILVFRFATGNSIEYHQNQSIETLGNCNQLLYKLETNFWGGFRECECGEYAFGEDCGPLGGRQQHAGGKSVLAFDQDHDGDHDVIFGDEFCTNIAFLENFGDVNDALFTEALLDYPSAANPIDFFIFPGLFWEDLNFDGRKDLVASPNVFENFGLGVDFKHSSHLYTNDGITDGEFFTFQTDEFLQNAMIELGESVVPVFFDTDSDGDEDLIMGHRGTNEGSNFMATFHHYENVGSAQQSEFVLSSEDYLELSSENLNTLKPSFGDLDGDGRSDLIFSAANASGQTFIWYFLNSTSSGFDPINPLPSILPVTIQAGDHPFFQDINSDGRADMLLGRRTGRLEYWINTSSGGTFSFELVDEAFAGIIDDSFRRELVPLTGDINNDGALELITTDATGVMRVYTDFIDNNNGQQVNDMVIEPAEGMALTRSRWGRGASLAIANLGNQLPHLVVGSKQGGLLLLENYSSPGNGSGGESFTFELFPNPALEEITLRGNQNFTIEIYNTLGQLVMGDLGNPDQSLIRFDSRQLQPGIYLVNAISSSGSRKVHKLIIARE
jgi:hypothetical protein